MISVSTSGETVERRIFGGSSVPVVQGPALRSKGDNAWHVSMAR